jgi:acylphosphatase
VPQQVQISFIGRLNPASFRDFVLHRAERLDMDVHVGMATSHRIDVGVTGAPDLVDAFEMACSLGPIDCLVLDYQRTSNSHSPDDKEDLQ